MTNIFKSLGVAGLLLTLTGFGQIQAAGPQSIYGSGVYRTLDMDSAEIQTGRSGLSVGEFKPRLHDKVSGITDQIFFECSSDRGLVSVGGLSSFADYIRSAFVEQLQISDSYGRQSSVQVSGQLQKIDLYLDRLIGESSSQGTWSIQLTLSSSLGREETFNVNSSHLIRNQGDYCREMAGQFMTSVQALMLEIFGSARFDRLFLPAGMTFR